MVAKIREKLNGHAPKVIEAIVIGGIILWMFCVVRDLPATYATKEELRASQASIKQSIDQMDSKIDDIHFYLMGKRR